MPGPGVAPLSSRGLGSSKLRLSSLLTSVLSRVQCSSVLLTLDPCLFYIHVVPSFFHIPFVLRLTVCMDCITHYSLWNIMLHAWFFSAFSLKWSSWDDRVICRLYTASSFCSRRFVYVLVGINWLLSGQKLTRQQSTLTETWGRMWLGGFFPPGWLMIWSLLARLTIFFCTLSQKGHWYPWSDWSLLLYACSTFVHS